MIGTQLRELLKLLDGLDEAMEEIGFLWWRAETLWPAIVNRWIGEAGQ